MALFGPGIMSGAGLYANKQHVDRLNNSNKVEGNSNG